MDASTKTALCGMAGAIALMAAGAAFAAPRASEAQMRYQQERSACMSGASNQDRATCLKEAVAAYQEARKGALSGSEQALAQNRTARCTALPQPERDECVQRMQAGTSTGTARDGGILRENTTSVPAR
jgi:hypothetical protein